MQAIRRLSSGYNFKAIVSLRHQLMGNVHNARAFSAVSDGQGTSQPTACTKKDITPLKSFDITQVRISDRDQGQSLAKDLERVHLPQSREVGPEGQPAGGVGHRFLPIYSKFALKHPGLRVLQRDQRAGGEGLPGGGLHFVDPGIVI
jgi:hypothetical protein